MSSTTAALDPWVSARPELLRLESVLARDATKAVIMRDGSTIIMREAVRYGGRRFLYEVRFAPNHPFAAPGVYLLEPGGGPAIAEVHRYRNGALCLHAPEEWLPTHTVAVWIRNRVMAWIAHYTYWLDRGRWPGTLEL